MKEKETMLNGIPMSTDVVPASNGCSDGGCGNWSWWIIILLIFGFGGFGGLGRGSEALTRGELGQDFNFNDLQNSVRSAAAENNANFRTIDNSVCTLGYQNAQLINGVQMQLGNEFRGIDNAVCTLGYQNQQGFNDVNASIMAQGNNISRDVERGFCQTNYNMSTQNCATLQAIDKVGDRVIDYLSNQEAQRLRDENFALKLSASQERQNNYLVNELRPCPTPAYITCNPWASNYGYGYNSCSGCNV